MSRLIQGMSDESYFKSERLSQSKLKKLLQNPFEEKKEYNLEAMSEGKALHCALLEPAHYKERFYTFDDFKTYGAKIASRNIEKDKIGIHANFDAIITKAQKNIKNNTFLSNILSFGVNECVIFFEMYGEKCKAKLDKLIVMDDKIIIIDPKTVGQTYLFDNASSISRYCSKYGYDFQAAFYINAAKSIYGEDKPIVFMNIFIEKDSDASVYPAFISQSNIEIAQLKVMRAFSIIEEKKNGLTKESFLLDKQKESIELPALYLSWNDKFTYNGEFLMTKQNNLIAIPEARELLRKCCDEAKSTFMSAGLADKYDKEMSFAAQVVYGNLISVKPKIREQWINTLSTPQGKVSLNKAIKNIANLNISLNPVLQYAYLIPRKGEVCLDISYRGLIYTATTTKKIIACNADVVREGDEFVMTSNFKEPIHKFNYFDKNRMSRTVVGAYACLKISESTFYTEVMSLDELEKIRAMSNMAKFGAWEDHTSEMYKKTVVKRAMKWCQSDCSELLAKQIEHCNEYEGVVTDFDIKKEEASIINATMADYSDKAKEFDAELLEADKKLGETNAK